MGIWKLVMFSWLGVCMSPRDSRQKWQTLVSNCGFLCWWNFMLEKNGLLMWGHSLSIFSGLSRQLAMDASHIHTRTTGTVTHMPPELFNEERLTNASDVYSFGILSEYELAFPVIFSTMIGDYWECKLCLLVWELMAGEAPLLGVPHFVVMKKILLDNWRPTFPDESPKSYQALAEQCWDCAASSRPSFEEVMKMLIEMRVEFTGSDTGRSRWWFCCQHSIAMSSSVNYSNRQLSLLH